MEAVTTLADFLLARTDEDEAKVQRPLRTGWGRTNIGWLFNRVLAECDAKRKLVELHRPVEGEFHHGSSTGSRAADLDNLNGSDSACATCGEFSEYGVPWPCQTLRLLALPYVDHLDFSEEWKP